MTLWVVVAQWEVLDFTETRTETRLVRLFTDEEQARSRVANYLSNHWNHRCYALPTQNGLRGGSNMVNRWLREP